MNITGLVVGGGTLIGSKFWDYELFEKIVKTGKPVYIHGTGVHKMNFYHELWKKMLGSSFFGGVRGPVSKDNLDCINIKANPVGDAAFAMFKCDNWPAYNKNGKNVLINLGAHGGYPGEENSRIELKKYIEFVIDSGFSIQFLPLHTIDVKLGMELKAIFPEITLLEIPKSYNEGIKYFCDCTFAIGERLHFNVMALLAGCPFLSINYGPKHEDFLASLHLAPQGLKPEELTVDKLLVAFQNRDTFNWDITLKKIRHYKKMQFDEQAKFMSNLS